MESLKKKAGRISPAFMGDYDHTTNYRRLDWVYYGGTSYICKKNNTTGITPTNTEKWQRLLGTPTELNMFFDEATTRSNISSGEKLSVILGKIKKCITDLKQVAYSGSYNDLKDVPNSLKNPNALNIKFNGVSKVDYDGSDAKEVNITPADISAVNTSTILTTPEQISANTSAVNITGALAAKAMIADYDTKIGQLNSNLSTEWASATISSNASGSVQWHRWGLVCEVVIAANITMPKPWVDVEIATNLPPSRFGSGMRGIIQNQETGLAYCVLINNNGELVVRSDANPQSGWYRGGVTYIVAD